jgi:hypothetical protein
VRMPSGVNSDGSDWVGAAGLDKACALPKSGERTARHATRTAALVWWWRVEIGMSNPHFPLLGE